MRLFKEALSNFASGVVVITTSNRDKVHMGLTVSSFASVSLSPPLVSFCICNNSHTLQALEDSMSFAVSILNHTQSKIADNFANKSLNKFSNQQYTLSHNIKHPLINGAISWLECEVVHQYNGGDHKIILGKVSFIQNNNDLAPLIYVRRKYYSLNNLDPIK